MKSVLFTTLLLFYGICASADTFVNIGSGVTLTEFIESGAVITDYRKDGVGVLFFDISQLKECEERLGVSASHQASADSEPEYLSIEQVASHIYRVQITEDELLETKIIVTCFHDGYLGGYRVGL